MAVRLTRPPNVDLLRRFRAWADNNSTFDGVGGWPADNKSTFDGVGVGRGGVRPYSACRDH
ncbi:hypothetical protein I548_5353 [Mycobacterium intracellulare]|nr:hypothetical protein I548_5353 [Mycobacterium intracellulare]